MEIRAPTINRIVSLKNGKRNSDKWNRNFFNKYRYLKKKTEISKTEVVLRWIKIKISVRGNVSIMGTEIRKSK